MTKHTALKSQDVSLDERIGQIAAEALLAGGRYRVRRVSNALALLRELRMRGPSSFKFDTQLNALERVWRSMQKAGTAHREPKLLEKELLDLLARQE